MMRLNFHEIKEQDGSIRRLAWHEWGDSGNPKVLFCVHGITRLSKDFEFIAKAMQKEYRIIAVDMAGRGDSDWLKNAAEYRYNTYVNDCISLLQHLHIQSVDWFGTSMGGIIGMFVYAKKRKLINRLILNDIGAFIRKDALNRIAAYVMANSENASKVYDNLEEVEQYMRKIAASFGIKKASQWRHLAEISSVQVEGGFRLHYDPAISQPLVKKFQEGGIKDVNLWPLWRAIDCPVLLIRGMDSDILPHDIALKMSQTGTCAELLEFEGVGHAPPMLEDSQIEPVKRWLQEEYQGKNRLINRLLSPIYRKVACKVLLVS